MRHNQFFVERRIGVKFQLRCVHFFGLTIVQVFDLEEDVVDRFDHASGTSPLETQPLSFEELVSCHQKKATVVEFCGLSFASGTAHPYTLLMGAILYYLVQLVYECDEIRYVH